MSLDINDVEFWVREALKNEKMYDLEVFKHSKTVESSNYQADLMYVSAKGMKTDGKEATYELLVKMGKQDKELRQKFPLRIINEREVYVYRTILPEFKNFEVEKHVPEFSAIPKCYGTFLTEDPDQEVVVMENIQFSGFKINDQSQYFNENHLKLTLEVYAHWHALSFAFRKQRPQKYLEIFDNLISPFREYHNQSSFNILPDIISFALDILKNKNEVELGETFKRKTNDNFLQLLNSLSREAEKDSSAVFVHGDCWKDNFMFKYKEGDHEKNYPQDAIMLDFQMSTLSSPVWDLAYHLYCVMAPEDFDKIEKYLKVYHEMLSAKLKELHCDPKIIYPFENLIEHWKRYSFLGVWQSLIIQFMLMNKILLKWMERTDQAEEQISLKVVAILRHYFLDLF